MADTECIARLGGWEGYEYVESWEEQRGKARWCVVRLRPIAGIARTCSGCGASTVAIHDSEERRVRDLPIFEVPVELVVPRLRVACGACGPKLERLNWLEAYARVTSRLAGSVARLCSVEGINNTIKVIKRMAYGYRDDAYFFLRIRAAFPGIR